MPAEFAPFSMTLKQNTNYMVLYCVYSKLDNFILYYVFIFGYVYEPTFNTQSTIS